MFCFAYPSLNEQKENPEKKTGEMAYKFLYVCGQSAGFKPDAANRNARKGASQTKRGRVHWLGMGDELWLLKIRSQQIWSERGRNCDGAGYALDKQSQCTLKLSTVVFIIRIL